MTRDGDDGCRWFSEYPSCEWAPALLALEDYGGERVAQALQQTILYQEDGESIARPPVLQQTLDACRIAQRVVDEILEGRHAPPKSRQNLFDRLKEIFNALLFRCYLGALLDEDMVLVYKRTVRYAKREIARLNATSGRYSPSLTTGGDEAEDLAQQAFRLAFSGQRSWPCERLPLVPFLQGTVKSLASHEIDRHRRRPQHVSLDPGAADTDDSSAISQQLDRLSGDSLSPEEALRRRDAVLKAIGNDRELRSITERLLCGQTPKQVAADLGISLATVYRRIRHLVAAIDATLSIDRKLRNKERS